MMVEYNIEDEIRFQPAKFRLLHNEKEIKLSQKETEVLFLLCQNAQHVVERKVFLHEIWDNREGGDISLNKSVLTLRRKFESLGYLNGIDTIPRIGYMFRLGTTTIEVIKPDVDSDYIHGNARPTAMSQEQGRTYHKGMAWLFFVLIGTFPFLIYKIHDIYVNHEKQTLSYKIAFENNLLEIIELADRQEAIDYKKFVALLPLNQKLTISVSNLAISFIENRYGTDTWSKVFILDHKNNTQAQLTCIANYINKASAMPTKKDDTQEYTPPIIKHASAFHKKQFYSSCLGEKPDYLGEISIHSTYYPSDHPKSKQPSSLLQDIVFNDNEDHQVFHFNTVSRVNHINEGGNEFDFFIRLTTKSLKVNFIDQKKINKNKYLNMIFNEFEDDDIYLKSVTSADGKNVTVLSSVFDGSLSQGVINEQ